MTAIPYTPVPPVGTPIYGCGFMLAAKRYFQGYVKFEGKASRSEFWWAYLAINILALIPVTVSMVLYFMAIGNFAIGMGTSASYIDESTFASMIGTMVGGMLLAFLPAIIFSFGIMLPTHSLMTRRLRDAGFSPWLVLLSVVGLGTVPLIMCIMDTKRDMPYYGGPGYGAAGYAAPGYQEHTPQYASAQRPGYESPVQSYAPPVQSYAPPQ